MNGYVNQMGVLYRRILRAGSNLRQIFYVWPTPGNAIMYISNGWTPEWKTRKLGRRFLRSDIRYLAVLLVRLRAKIRSRIGRYIFGPNSSQTTIFKVPWFRFIEIDCIINNVSGTIILEPKRMLMYQNTKELSTKHIWLEGVLLS